MEDLRAWLARYGAPLLGGSAVEGHAAPSREDVFAEALALARKDSSVARALPVALWRNRSKLDLLKLKAMASSAGQERTLGFFLDLTGRLGHSRKLTKAARSLHKPSPRLTPFFALRTRAERELAAHRTPDVARDWGFSMNMPLDSFETMFRKSETRAP